MLLIHIEKDRTYSSYNAFSLLKRRDHTALEDCETSLPWNHVRLQGISPADQRAEVELIKTRLNDESVQLGEYKLNRALLADNDVFTGSNSGKGTGFQLKSLIGAFYHYKKKPEKLDVDEFVEFVRTMRSMVGAQTNSRYLPGLFTTYDGKILFGFFLNNRLHFEEITQTSVIENMKVSHVSDMIFAARKDAERRHVERLNVIDEVEKACDSYHFEVVRKLTQGGVLGFAGRT